MENPDKVRLLGREYRIHQRMYPRHSVRFICNAEAEYDLLRKHRLPALFVSKNAFLSSEVYQPIPDTHRRYDAVLNSRMARFKRCELAKQIERLVVITRPTEGQEDYLSQIREELGHADWANYQRNGVY